MKKLLFFVGLLSPAFGLAQVAKSDSVVVVRSHYGARGRQLSFYRASRADSVAKPFYRVLQGTEAQQTETLQQLQALLLQQGYSLTDSLVPGPVPTGFMIYTKAK